MGGEAGGKQIERTAQKNCRPGRTAAQRFGRSANPAGREGGHPNRTQDNGHDVAEQRRGVQNQNDDKQTLFHTFDLLCVVDGPKADTAPSLLLLLYRICPENTRLFL